METVKLIGYESPFVVADILWVQAQRSYSILHHIDGKQTLVAKSMSYIGSVIPDLIRVHHSKMINSGLVTGFQFLPGKRLVFTLPNGSMLEASHTYYQKVTGNRINRPVVNLTTGMYFSQVTLAARAIGSTKSKVVDYLRGRRVSLVNGNRFRYAQPDEITAQRVLHF